jgi:hypothetical protein
VFKVLEVLARVISNLAVSFASEPLVLIYSISIYSPILGSRPNISCPK